jgi:hypothetical protein
VSLLFLILVIFGALSWQFSCGDFEAILFGIWSGMYAITIHGSFPFNSPPKSVSKGARFWGFLLSRVRDVLGGISSIPLDLASFGRPNLGYGVPMRCSYFDQSLVRILGANREIGVGFGGVDPRALVIPRAQVLTGLTGASHWSDRCRLLVDFCSCECFGEFLVVSCCCYFEFGQFWSSVGLFGRFGIS